MSVLAGRVSDARKPYNPFVPTVTRHEPDYKVHRVLMTVDPAAGKTVKPEEKISRKKKGVHGTAYDNDDDTTVKDLRN